jgi:hypothetical protein
MSYLFDTFSNFLSGLGMPGRDKMTATQYVTLIWTREQLESSYRSDWIARKAISIPAFDATREWRSWQAEQDQIGLLEATEKRVQLQLKLQQALTKARLYGGCGLLIGVEGDMTQELKPETIKKDGLKFIHVLAPHQLIVEQLIRDITSPYYGQPEFYILRTDSTVDPASVAQSSFTGEVKIHPSRMVRLIGLDPPDPMLTWGWGDPLLQTIHDSINSAGTVMQSIAVLISEAKVDVIKIPGLTEIFSTQRGTDKLVKRFSEANVAKSVINAVVLDAEEDWQRIAVQFRGMPEVLQMYLQIAAGAADIPATRFLGISPAGMNATGESDLHNYYDRISSEQELRLSPALEILDKAVMQSALGKIDDNIFYEWNPLWQMDEAQKTDIAYKKAQATQLDVSSGLVPFEALVKGKCNQLIEDGTYPGLETAIEEAIAHADQAAEEEAQSQQAQQMPGADPNEPPPPPNGGGGPPPTNGGGGGGGGGPPPPRPPPPPKKPSPEAALKRGAVDSDFVDTLWLTVDEAAWNEGAHTRGQPKNAGQFGPGGGGSTAKSSEAEAPKGGSSGALEALAKGPAGLSTPAKPIAATATHSETGAVFVSPSVKSGLDLKSASKEIESRQQATLRAASADINKQLGITDAREVNVVGAWSDGAENALMTRTNADWDHLVLSGVMKAHLADQKAVLVFQQQDGGKVALAQFEATGNLATIHKNLLKDGLENHTLVPTSNGARVYVVDLDGSQTAAVKKGASRYGKDNPVHVQFGRGEFIGTTKTDGSDREQRDSARSVYEAYINRSPVPGAAKIWSGIHDHWSPPTEAVGYNLTANAVIADLPTVKPNSVLVTSAAKQVNNRAGGVLEKELGVDHVDENTHTPETDAYLANALALDLKAELKSGESGEDWYDKTMKDALGVAGKIYPGVDTDPDKKFIYTTALAITSQGEVVDSSVRLADQAYTYYQEHGHFPSTIDTKDPSVGVNFQKMNSLIKVRGVAGARKMFDTEMTAGELTKQTGVKVKATFNSDKVYGSAMLGPKIGQGFYQNLNGNFKPITMDMWFMRSWGRITNTGVSDGDMTPQVDRVNNALTHAGMPMPKTKQDTIKVAEQIYKQHEEDYAAHQAEYKSGKREKSELVHASERLTLHAKGAMVETPKNAKQRAWITDVVHSAIDKLAKEDNIHLTPASAQAIWWWPEKQLWQKMGVRSKEQDTDYAKSLRKLAEKKGIKV